LDSPFVPIDAVYQLPRARVNVNRRPKVLRIPERVQFVFIAVDGYLRYFSRQLRRESSTPSWCRTYSAAEWSTCNHVVLELEVLVKHRRVQLDLAVEAVAHALPVGRRFRHVMGGTLLAGEFW